MNKTTKKILIFLAIFIGAFFLLGITSIGFVVYQLGFTEKGAEAFGEFSTNFNNAQYRAKVARSNADIRMM
ncbi:hypothetical protein K8I31_21640 [bacterium]|nr:hypothetical protein [bacterium]